MKNIPTGFEQILNLEVLDRHQNQFDGTIEEKFLLLSNASYVDFSSNLLSSSGSQKWKFLFGISDSIKYLNLSNNQFTGSLISGGGLPAFGSLKVLDLSYNQLSGELPGFEFVYDLEVLRLGNHMFSGFIPNGLLHGDSLVLTELDLSANNLSGPIHTSPNTTH
ncbi:putative LRR receptor-like serine/threonine-protein kinase [Cinnamomum micranthum f. kanehirae]|uniref:Putative LRR receptor-like serine/threonine-protein kinase n=1 Tax=Cinnamomum micranthum f. kanehirae TaxID=337451 RepID=A0A3S3MV11_9MAGN|nr:putative LRR receptor-like serine/threonine-protein kinase [Cinnamomum micranthum f. kanehirae]